MSSRGRGRPHGQRATVHLRFKGRCELLGVTLAVPPLPSSTAWFSGERYLKRVPSLMPNLTPLQLKRALIDAGFIIFRTLADEVVVAERVRENLIMDSGIRLRCAPELAVRVFIRIQRGNFPGEDDTKLYERARTAGAPALEEDFTEVAHQLSHVTDPGDSTRTLDTFYEVVYSRDAESLDAAIEGVRFAFTLSRVSHA